MKFTKEIFPIFFIAVTLCVNACQEDFQEHLPLVHSVSILPESINSQEIVSLSIYSTDGNGDKLSYSWESDFGYFLSSTNLPQTTWQAPFESGNYTIFFTVDDGKNFVQDSVLVIVNNLPPKFSESQQPANGSKDVKIPTTLFWNATDFENDSLVYDLYFGENGSFSLQKHNLATNFFNPILLEPETNYTWKVVAKNLENEIQTESEIWSFKTGKWANFRIDNSGLPIDLAFSVAIDNEKKWIGTYGNGLILLENENWIVFNTDNSPISDDKILSVAVDKNGTKWIGTDSGGLTIFYGENWRTFQVGNSALISNSILTVQIDQNDKKWFGTLHGGLTTFDNYEWETFAIGNSGLTDNTVLSIAFENDKTWIGTSSGGVVSLENGIWEVFNTSNSPLPINRVNSISVDRNGKKWFGTPKGLVSFDGQNWQVFTEENSDLLNDQVFSLNVDSKNKKWIGTSQGLSSFDGKYWNSYKDFFGSNILEIKIDEFDKKWISTEGSGLVMTNEQ